MLKKAFIGAAKLLEDNKEEVNALNVFPVPDGDTGTNMSLTMKSAVNQIMNLEEYSASKVAMAASNGSLMGARGNSGVILSQLFRGFAIGFKNKDKVDTIDLAEAFRLASDTAYKAVMKPTEGTILTVARGCAEYALELAKEEKDILIFMEKVINYGNQVLNRTPDMLPVLKQAGVVDAGGKGLIVVLTGAYNAITTKDDISLDDFQKEFVEQIPVPRHIETSDIEFGYCTEFMIKTQEKDYESFREELTRFGDSLMVVGGDGLIKVHIHTNNPGEVLEKALIIGELNDIKIDNMRYQHSHIMENEQKEYSEQQNKQNEETKKYGFITVSIGEGLDTVFNELNVDYVIPGGQTMNPSTEDILTAIEEVNADNIIILPNNGNIILAADQAKELSGKNVYVFPTKTIPEGITALLSFNPDLDMEDNILNMEEAVAHVKTGQVTYAVRDTEIKDSKINKDDIIGISKGEILSIGDDIEKVSFELLKNIVDDDSSLITIFYGNGIEEEMATKLCERVEEEFEDFDVEVIFGGQPLYYYIFSIE
ncbi:DAK2 domain-containing protein [Clostridium sp. Cult2]|uniref:DAK2 domain-containing protein n=1 Tax=Clostridium sp. Cult2 TaxID=2079003 RepID=UPI001F1AE46C|nr:DAK2 domain-containing protein [Clostridium sp. Cult2]MCF6466420.1 dihydroxyacetone kinase [Clostridium sp. Cult2]